MIQEPVPVVAGRWYVAWARVSGCSSDCGSSGQSTVTTEDQVHQCYIVHFLAQMQYFLALWFLQVAPLFPFRGWPLLFIGWTFIRRTKVGFHLFRKLSTACMLSSGIVPILQNIHPCEKRRHLFEMQFLIFYFDNMALIKSDNN